MVAARCTISVLSGTKLVSSSTVVHGRIYTYNVTMELETAGAESQVSVSEKAPE